MRYIIFIDDIWYLFYNIFFQFLNFGLYLEEAGNYLRNLTLGRNAETSHRGVLFVFKFLNIDKKKKNYASTV